MLPIMTGVFCWRMPKVAVKTAKVIIKKKSWLGVLPATTLSTALVLSVSFRLVKRVTATIYCSRCYMVGEPRIELGSHAPHARILPLNYSPETAHFSRNRH